jgi:limonene-1,2-epoxide hydrolase
LEVGHDGSWSMLGFVEGKIAEEISVVGKGTSGSAFFTERRVAKRDLCLMVRAWVCCCCLLDLVLYWVVGVVW